MTSLAEISEKVCAIAMLTTVTLALAGCGGGSDDKSPTGSTPASASTNEQGISDEQIARYKERVSRRFGNAIANALAKDLSISVAEAECLMADDNFIDIERLGVDNPAIAALFDRCGVDPAVMQEQ